MNETTTAIHRNSRLQSISKYTTSRETIKAEQINPLIVDLEPKMPSIYLSVYLILKLFIFEIGPMNGL